MRSPEETVKVYKNHGPNKLEIRETSPPKYQWSMTLVKGAYPKFNFPKAPNRFHRFMQRIAFGFHWSRIDQEKK